MFNLAATALSARTKEKVQERPDETSLFHILFRDTKHNGDHHLTLIAKDAPSALKKCERHLQSKNADHSTVQVMTDKNYRKTFPIDRRLFYAFYHNGRPKYCPILAINSAQAEEIFSQRFGFRPESIMDKTTFEFEGKSLLRTMAN